MQEVLSGNSSLPGSGPNLNFFRQVRGEVKTRLESSGPWLSPVRNNPQAKVAHAGVIGPEPPHSLLQLSLLPDYLYGDRDTVVFIDLPCTHAQCLAHSKCSVKVGGPAWGVAHELVWGNYGVKWGQTEGRAAADQPLAGSLCRGGRPLRDPTTWHTFTLGKLTAASLFAEHSLWLKWNLQTSFPQCFC